jgi:hypothetical protein
VAEGGPLVESAPAVSVALWAVTVALLVFLVWRIVTNVDRRDWLKVFGAGTATFAAAVVGSYLSPSTWHVDGRLAVSSWIVAAIVIGRGDPTQVAPHSIGLRNDRRALTDDDMGWSLLAFVGLGLVLYFAAAWFLGLH